MEFRTKVNIESSGLTIDYDTRLCLFGSCFIEHIGRYLNQNKFNAQVNPFGVLYNPLSISQSIGLLLDDRIFSESDLIHDKGLYHSFDYHGSFSSPESSIILNSINDASQIASQTIKNADLLIITFGTSFVYEYIPTGKIVSNCHKIQANQFRRFRLREEEIVLEWLSLIDRLIFIKPTIKILFTVSPIRHLKDGAHGNQLSKATLLMAIDQIVAERKNCYYFPSYEIMLDELRDYRFYADDMLHPSSMAIEYIWKIFSESYFSPATHSILKQWNSLLRSINHRPFNEQTKEHKHFIRQTLLKLEDFQNKYPYFDCHIELNQMRARLS